MNDLTTKPKDLPLQSLLIEHVRSGIPTDELNCSKRDRDRIKAIMRAYEHYKHNPWMSVRDWFVHREYPYISHDFMPTALELFEYLRVNLSDYNTSSDRDMIKFAARTAIKHGASTGDDHKMLKGADLLLKANGGFKDSEENDIAKSTASLPWFLVRSPKKVSEDAIDMSDAELIEEMNRWGAAIDPSFLKIVQQSGELAISNRKAQEQRHPNYVTPDYITDDLFDEYDL